MMTSNRGGNAGFSLMELLIAITILGFILTLLFTAFRLVQRSWDAAEKHIESTSQSQIGRQFLSNLIAQASPLVWKNSPEKYLAFSGTATELRLVTELPAHFDGGGLQQVALTVETDGESSSLIFSNAPLKREAIDFDVQSNDNSHVIIDKAKKIAFSYYGPEKTGAVPNVDAPARWTNDWDKAGQLPKLIRIQLETDPRWPDLFISPMLSLAGGCLWDDFYKRCVPGK